MPLYTVYIHPLGVKVSCHCNFVYKQITLSYFGNNNIEMDDFNPLAGQYTTYLISRQYHVNKQSFVVLGTAHLLDEIDKKLMVLLRDGRTLIGFLRSCDQFANLVLHNTIERIHVDQEYGDIQRQVKYVFSSLRFKIKPLSYFLPFFRGTMIIRGENVVLLGEIVCTIERIFF